MRVAGDLLCVIGIPEKYLNRMLLLLILKTSRRRCTVKKVILKILPILEEIPVLESLSSKFAGMMA